MIKLLKLLRIKQNYRRSLKNYIEDTLENTVMQYTEPSKEYKTMMDTMLDRMERDDIDFIPIEDIKKKYGI